MEHERRSAPRVRVNLPARFEGAIVRGKATVSDLSHNGCFLLTGGKVEVKELVFLEIELPTGSVLEFWAEVVDEASEIGFAVRFNSSSEDDELRLSNYIEAQLRSQPTKKFE
jgi:PilZ domain